MNCTCNHHKDPDCPVHYPVVSVKPSTWADVKNQFHNVQEAADKLRAMLPKGGCPLCSSPVEEAEYCETTADYNGEPVENSGWALYCTKKTCDHYMEPIDEGDLEHDCHLSPEAGCVCAA